MLLCRKGKIMPSGEIRKLSAASTESRIHQGRPLPEFQKKKLMIPDGIN